MISLDATALRALATHIDYLTQSANSTGVKSASDMPDSVQMSGWAHSLQIERAQVPAPTDDDADHTAEVYRLCVGSPW